jgi:hypothetical protein
VDVENTVHRKFIPAGLGNVDRGVGLSMSKALRLIAGRHPDVSALEPGERASSVGDLEDWLRSRDQPGL